jgi:hypothetical protein
MKHSMLLHLCYFFIVGAILAACSSNSEPIAQTSEKPVSINQTPIQREDTLAQSNKTSLPSTDTPIPSTDTPISSTDTPIPPIDTPIPPTDTPMPPTFTPTPTIDLAMEVAEGDPVRGRIVAVKKGCFGCHVDPAENGPYFGSSDELPRIMERGEMRIADPAYDSRATTNLEYVIESIFIPEVYVLPGEWEKEMPTAFFLQITDAELANIIAWLQTLE